MACRVRLRPVLMTSLATIIGLLPMALKLGAGSEAYAPLARAILGGLSVSVVLTVFLVPAAYFLVYGERRTRIIDAFLFIDLAVALVCLGPAAAYGQPRMHLTLAEAQRLAIQNNPQFTAAKYNAAAAYQVAPQYKAGLRAHSHRQPHRRRSRQWQPPGGRRIEQPGRVQPRRVGPLRRRR